jgi:DNA-binding transcriptional regulator LsrR (DeoR family)
MSKEPISMLRLGARHIVGDMLWRPIGEGGPIVEETKIRAMGLLELDELPELIAQGKKVILTVGPCGQCGRLRTRITRTILGLSRRLITHLVIDSRTAQAILDCQENARRKGAAGNPVAAAP